MFVVRPFKDGSVPIPVSQSDIISGHSHAVISSQMRQSRISGGWSFCYIHHIKWQCESPGDVLEAGTQAESGTTGLQTAEPMQCRHRRDVTNVQGSIVMISDKRPRPDIWKDIKTAKTIYFNKSLVIVSFSVLYTAQGETLPMVSHY